MTDAVDSTAEDLGTDLEPVAVASPAGAALAVTPQVKASELVERLDVIREAADSAMKENVDYGVIPGTDKPALFKPGAEKLSVLFQLDVQLENEKQWGPGDHLTVLSRATVYHAPTGARLGFGEGLCTTREKRYAYRRADRVCPECGKPAIIKGKKEYGGGWVCFKKKDGCGKKFDDTDPAITGQAVGDIENPDLPDLWNTVVKMAEKRARVDAVLAVTGASALFTQDIEDAVQPREPEPTGASDITPPRIGPDQYKRLVELFQTKGSPEKWLTDALDILGAPTADSLAGRVALLDSQQAADLEAELTDLPVATS